MGSRKIISSAMVILLLETEVFHSLYHIEIENEIVLIRTLPRFHERAPKREKYFRVFRSVFFEMFQETILKQFAGHLSNAAETVDDFLKNEKSFCRK